MVETKFNNFTEFINRINLTDRISDSGIFILHLSEVSESILWEFSMYRNEFYEINIFNGLSNFRYAIDGTFYTLNGQPTLFFIAPNQLQSYEILKEEELNSGYLIFIKKSSFKQIEKSSGIHYFKREYESCYQVSEQDYQKIIFWIDLMYRESKSTSEFKSQFLHNLLIILLLKIKEMVHEELHLIYGRPQKTVGNLIDFIETCHRIPKVSECASHLALTPKQLNSITKQVLGKTANEVIKSQFSEKAKAFLIQSELSVKEIAQKLGFEEVSNFSRFFKGVNQVSPIVYREQKGAK